MVNPVINHSLHHFYVPVFTNKLVAEQLSRRNHVSHPGGGGSHWHCPWGSHSLSRSWACNGLMCWWWALLGCFCVHNHGVVKLCIYIRKCDTYWIPSLSWRIKHFGWCRWKYDIVDQLWDRIFGCCNRELMPCWKEYSRSPAPRFCCFFFAANTLLALLLRYEDSTEGPILLSDNRKSKCSIGAPFTDARISQDS